jgi:hypothetical protein
MRVGDHVGWGAVRGHGAAVSICRLESALLNSFAAFTRCDVRARRRKSQVERVPPRSAANNGALGLIRNGMLARLATGVLVIVTSSVAPDVFGQSLKHEARAIVLPGNVLAGYAALQEPSSVFGCMRESVEGRIVKVVRDTNGVKVDGFSIEGAAGKRDYVNVDLAAVPMADLDRANVLLANSQRIRVTVFRCGAAGRVAYLDEFTVSVQEGRAPRTRRPPRVTGNSSPQESHRSVGSLAPGECIPIPDTSDGPSARIFADMKAAGAVQLCGSTPAPK